MHSSCMSPRYIGENGDGWLEGPPLVSDVSVSGNTFRDYYASPYGIVAWDKTTRAISIRNNTCELNSTTVKCAA